MGIVVDTMEGPLAGATTAMVATMALVVAVVARQTTAMDMMQGMVATAMVVGALTMVCVVARVTRLMELMVGTDTGRWHLRQWRCRWWLHLFSLSLRQHQLSLLLRGFLLQPLLRRCKLGRRVCSGRRRLSVLSFLRW